MELLLVDANNIALRSYHALKQTMGEEGGPPYWAVHGTVRSIAAIVKRVEPTHLLCAFDSGKSVYRSELYDQYKANRRKAPTDDATPSQAGAAVEYCRRILRVLGIACHSEEGVEADDVIATATQRWDDPFDTDSHITILTGDKDMRQLVSDSVTIYEPSHGYGTEPKVWTPSEVVEKYGVDPMFLPDWLALAGDASDGYPGVKGIGPKAATALIKQYGSARVAAVLSDDKRMQGQRAIVDVGMDLAQLRGDIAELPVELEDLRFDPIMPGDGLASSVEAVLDEMELETIRSLWVEGRLWETQQQHLKIGRTLAEAVALKQQR